MSQGPSAVATPVETARPAASLHAAWEAEEHAILFDRLRFVPSIIQRWYFERFHEFSLLREVLCAGQRATVLEIGCATGEFCRYVTGRYSGVTYVGCDISAPAIARAKEKFADRGQFVVTDMAMSAVRHVRASVVFCRDVVHHQADPRGFLERLYGLTEGVLILRLRTRDHGPTEWDPERSCQFHTGSWVPYIVWNCNELIEMVRRFSPPPRCIKLLKHYMILGGRGDRYLPKACYDPDSGTAETAVLLQKKDAGFGEPTVEISSGRDGDWGFSGRIIGELARKSAAVVRAVVGAGYRGQTWW